MAKPIRFRSLPGIRDLEHIFVSVQTPALEDAGPLQERIDAASQEIFGIVREDTFLWLDDDIDEANESDPRLIEYDEECEANEARYRSDKMSNQEQIDYLLELGFDFTDEYGLRLRVTDHFCRQAEAAAKNLAGNLPNTEESDLQDWSSKLQQDSLKFANTRRLNSKR